MKILETITRHNITCPYCYSKFSFLKGDIYRVTIGCIRGTVDINGIPSDLFCPVCRENIPIRSEDE